MTARPKTEYVRSKKHGWYEQRFTERKSAIKCSCEICNVDMWLPPSKAAKYKTCGGACASALQGRTAMARIRPYKTCGGLFTPRPSQIANGHGIFCSQKCNTNSRDAMLSEDSKKRSTEGFKKALAEGRYVASKGADHPSWKGGAEQSKKRHIESGRRLESCRRYRENNPEKMRKFTQRRKSKKLGRLPRGSIAFIGMSQKWLCVVCRCCIKKKYHVDHIQPIAKSGEHTRTNIQLLCPACNVKKSAKDPIEFMQSRGFLL